MRLFKAFFVIWLFSLLQAESQVPDHPNIIFITLDDLNDYIGVLGGHPQIQTPNIDSLAARGMLFINSYTNSPVCAPSRTSFMSGKDLKYTQVYNNNNVEGYFRDNFTAAKNNEEVISLPEHLKNNGYYTFSINKVFHNSEFPDFDEAIADPCEKDLSWSRVSFFGDFKWVKDQMNLAKDGVDGFQWGRTDDALEVSMKDSRAVDTAIQFLSDIESGDVDLCNGYFFLGLGISNPHQELFIPEHFFLPYYLDDFYDEPYQIPFNVPFNANPANGLIMPPQPDTTWNDYFHLGPLGQLVAQGQKDLEISFDEWLTDLGTLPEISDTLTTDERIFILEQSQRANAIMAYIAGVQYADAQIGRLMDALAAHPDIYNNTIIVLIGDNGFSFGEKRHWLKRGLWDTDIRVPFIIVDPEKTENQICNRTVSLLDIFPTICDLTNIPEPTFMDGSHYLDGKNITPLLNNPAKRWESPVLVTWEAEPNKECSCWPQYAVRNQRFHYIKYQSDNNVIGTNTCNLAGSIREEEFYDVGENMETDPYEWNNLINNEDYAPAIHYMQQFLPDSSLYLQKAYTVEITNNILPCFLASTYKLKLQSKLFNTNGKAISGAGLSDYEFRWTNSLTAAVQFGTSITFKVNTIPAATFASADRILFYLEVTQISTGKFVGFDTKTFYINSANTPSVSYDLAIDDVLNTATIIDYDINGSYTNTSWDFDDGFITQDKIPATHTYASNGTYTITNYVQYGNACTLPFSEIAEFTLRTGQSEYALNLYPNPTTNYLHVLSNHLFTPGKVVIQNILGEVVYSENLPASFNEITIYTGKLTQGYYLLKIESGETEMHAIFLIQR